MARSLNEGECKLFQGQDAMSYNTKKTTVCLCGSLDCQEISTAFRIIGDPRSKYVAVPLYCSNTKYSFGRKLNGLRTAYLKHLCPWGVTGSEDEGSISTISSHQPKKFIALHHFHPKVVLDFAATGHGRAFNVPWTLTKREMEGLEMNLDIEDCVLDDNFQPTDEYYFVPNYPLKKSCIDLENILYKSDNILHQSGTSCSMTLEVAKNFFETKISDPKGSDDEEYHRNMKSAPHLSIERQELLTDLDVNPINDSKTVTGEILLKPNLVFLRQTGTSSKDDVHQIKFSSMQSERTSVLSKMRHRNSVSTSPSYKRSSALSTRSMASVLSPKSQKWSIASRDSIGSRKTRHSLVSRGTKSGSIVSRGTKSSSIGSRGTKSSSIGSRSTKSSSIASRGALNSIVSKASTRNTGTYQRRSAEAPRHFCPQAVRKASALLSGPNHFGVPRFITFTKDGYETLQTTSDLSSDDETEQEKKPNAAKRCPDDLQRASTLLDYAVTPNNIKRISSDEIDVQSHSGHSIGEISKQSLCMKLTRNESFFKRDRDSDLSLIDDDDEINMTVLRNLASRIHAKKKKNMNQTLPEFGSVDDHIKEKVIDVNLHRSNKTSETNPKGTGESTKERHHQISSSDKCNKTTGIKVPENKKNSLTRIKTDNSELSVNEDHPTPGSAPCNENMAFDVTEHRSNTRCRTHSNLSHVSNEKRQDSPQSQSTSSAESMAYDISEHFSESTTRTCTSYAKLSTNEKNNNGASNKDISGTRQNLGICQLSRNSYQLKDAVSMNEANTMDHASGNRNETRLNFPRLNRGFGSRTNRMGKARGNFKRPPQTLSERTLPGVMRYPPKKNAFRSNPTHFASKI